VDGGTFRWGFAQRRDAYRATTTEPMDLCFYFTALSLTLEV
jgi:hypothetical protein